MIASAPARGDSAFLEAVSLLGDTTFAGVGVSLLAVVFVYTGIVKAVHPTPITIALVNFGLIRRAWRPAGLCLGLFEVALGTGLLLRYEVRVAALAAVGFFISATFLIGRALHAGQRFPCACFGQEDTGLSQASLVRALLLGLLSVQALVTSPRWPGWTDWTLQTAMAATLLGLIISGVALRRTVRHGRTLQTRVGSASLSAARVHEATRQ